MTFEIVLRYLHFISVFVIFGTLLTEHMLLKKQLTPAEVQRIFRVDAVYGLAATVLLIVGLTLWFGDVGKPAEFYTRNGLFHAKLTLFILVGLISIWPTVFYFKNAGSNQAQVTVPKSVVMMIRLELLLLLVIPLLAGLMAKGVGLKA